jgi:hypothetical protein
MHSTRWHGDREVTTAWKTASGLHDDTHNGPAPTKGGDPAMKMNVCLDGSRPTRHVRIAQGRSAGDQCHGRQTSRRGSDRGCATMAATIAPPATSQPRRQPSLELLARPVPDIEAGQAQRIGGWLHHSRPRRTGPGKSGRANGIDSRG